MNKYLPIAGIVIAVFVFFNSGGSVPDVDPVTPDPSPSPSLNVFECDKAYWLRYADLCDEMADKYPDGWTPQAKDVWNEALMIIRSETHSKINEAKSDAAVNGTMKEFATLIRNGVAK